jgi:hypothetical protein
VVNVPELLITAVVLSVMTYLSHTLRIMRKVQRDALPTNHPHYRRLTARERRRIGSAPW